MPEIVAIDCPIKRLATRELRTKGANRAAQNETAKQKHEYFLLGKSQRIDSMRSTLEAAKKASPGAPTESKSSRAGINKSAPKANKPPARQSKFFV